MYTTAQGPFSEFRLCQTCLKIQKVMFLILQCQECSLYHEPDVSEAAGWPQYPTTYKSHTRAPEILVNSPKYFDRKRFPLQGNPLQAVGGRFWRLVMHMVSLHFSQQDPLRRADLLLSQALGQSWELGRSITAKNAREAHYCIQSP